MIANAFIFPPSYWWLQRQRVRIHAAAPRLSHANASISMGPRVLPKFTCLRLSSVPCSICPCISNQAPHQQKRAQNLTPTHLQTLGLDFSHLLCDPSLMIFILEGIRSESGKGLIPVQLWEILRLTCRGSICPRRFSWWYLLPLPGNRLWSLHLRGFQFQWGDQLEWSAHSQR